MYCPKCRNILSDDSRFCSKCGYKIQSVTNTNNNQNMMSNAELQARLQLEQLKMQQQQIQIRQQQFQMQQQQYNSMLKCPKCGSTSVSSNKKGYGVVKGGLGAITAMGLAPFTGGASLAVGAIGAGAGNIGRNKIICTCMNCGYKFKPKKR